MKLTITQLRSIIKEEVTNKKATLARQNRALKEGSFVASRGTIEEQLEEVVIAYLEDKMMKKSMTVEGARELLMNEVESSYEMFAIHQDDDVTDRM